MARTKRLSDGEWVTPRHRGYHLGCCDCGLVHRIDFRIRAGQVQFRAFRHNRATAATRSQTRYEMRAV